MTCHDSALSHMPLWSTRSGRAACATGACHNSAAAMMTCIVERCENLKPYGFIDHGCMAGTCTTDLEAFDSYQVRLWNALVTASAKSALALVTAIWNSGCQSKIIACRH